MLDIELRKYWNTTNIPSNFLPWLSWALGVVIWPTRDGVRRAVTRGSFPELASRGTTKTLIEALACLGANATVQENINGAPFTATITINNSQDFNAAQRTELASIVDIYKRLSVVTTINYQEGFTLHPSDVVSGLAFKKVAGDVTH